MRRTIGSALLLAAVMACSWQAAGATQPHSAKGMIARYCIECHRVPGFAEEARNPDVIAPDFQTIADDRRTYTTERLVGFLRKPHFPMREFIFSEGDIHRIVSFIEGLRLDTTGAQ